MIYRIKITDQDGKEFWSKRFVRLYLAEREAKRWAGLKGYKVEVINNETGEIIRRWPLG